MRYLKALLEGKHQSVCACTGFQLLEIPPGDHAHHRHQDGARPAPRAAHLAPSRPLPALDPVHPGAELFAQTLNPKPTRAALQIDLSDNALQQLPAAIASLTRLATLRLSGNPGIKQLPRTMRGMTTLEVSPAALLVLRPPLPLAPGACGF